MVERKRTKRIPTRADKQRIAEAIFNLDNRKKINLLEIIRETCTDFGIQYILTLIDPDLPRDEQDQRIEFDESEIVRELHDDGEDGRLFRMLAF